MNRKGRSSLSNRWIGLISNLLAAFFITGTLISTLQRLFQSNLHLLMMLSFISLSLLEIAQLVMLLLWGLWRSKLVDANYSVLGIVSSLIRVIFPYTWSAIGLYFFSSDQTAQALQGLGFLIQTGSQVIALWAVLTLRGSFSVLPEAREVVSSGPYRFVRHPIYVAYILTMFSRWIQVPSWFSFLGCAFLAAIFVISTALEERELENLTGFTAYRDKVSRFVPFLW